MIVLNQTTYRGSASYYIKNFIIPSLPSVDDIITFTDSIYSYLKDENSIRYIRKFKSFNSRGKIYESTDKKFTVTDNEPALWFYMECLKGKVGEFARYEQNKSFPVAFALKEKEKAYHNPIFRYGKGLRENNFSSSGLKHCHILECSPRNQFLEHLSIDSRMVRLLSPMNHFPFPSPRKYNMTHDYGEDAKFLELVKNILYKEYYKSSYQKAKFLQFLRSAENNVLIDSNLDDMIIEFKLKYGDSNPQNNDLGTTREGTINHMAGIHENALGAHTVRSHFKISEIDYGKGLIVGVKFKRGNYKSKVFQYDHDVVYDKVIDHLKELTCWKKYGSYMNSSNIPGFAKNYVNEIEG